MEQLNKIEDTYYQDERRQRGIGKLAVHAAFEKTMLRVDAGEMTRDNGIAHMVAVRPLILRHAGVTEIAE